MSPFVGPESTGPRQQPSPISSPIPERSRSDHRAACAEQDLHAGNESWFEIYRAERVKLTSILFSGEDWRWRFRSSAGLIIASGTGFRTENECIAAVDALRRSAGTARVRGTSARPS